VIADFCVAITALFMGVCLTLASLAAIIAAPIAAFPVGFAVWVPASLFLMMGAFFIQAGLEHADETTDIRRVVAAPYLPADASGFRKVAFFNRHGFTLEGIARKFARLEDGTFVDAALMARVR
jgi:hypothetical protein